MLVNPGSLKASVLRLPIVRVFVLLILVLLAGGFGQAQAAGITLVQHIGKDAGTTTSSTLAFSSANTAGNFIAVVIRGGLSNSQVFAVSDSNSNTYKKAVQISSSGSAVTSAIYYAENIRAGANTISVTMTVSGPLRFAILEYSGVATSNSLDAVVAASTTSTSPNSGNLTTTANGDLLLGEVATADSTTFTGGAGFTVRDFVPAEPNTKLITEDQIQAVAGTASAIATLNPSSNWAALLAAFNPAGGVAASSIASLSPTSGPVGTSVTIAGTNFGASQGTSTVTFNGTPATPTSWGATNIVVPVPSGATSGNVVVTAGGVPSNGVAFTVLVPPSITGLSPSSGPVGTSITITGSNFGATRGTSTVTFNGAIATPTSWSNTSIAAPVPFGATSGNVVVTVGGVASNSVNFTVTVISVSVVPATISLPVSNGQLFTANIQNDVQNLGATWALSGTGCSGTACGTLFPGGSSTTISYVAPSGVPNPPTVTITATSVSDPTKSGTATITVTPPIPSITSLSPASGPATLSVTITGTNFGASQGTSTVTFNGTLAPSLSSWSASSIVALVPPGATTGNVVVTVGGIASNGVNFTVAPTVATFNPSTGPPGTSVTITGTGFGATQGTSTVTFNGLSATPTSWNNTTIVSPVPAGATTGSVVVTVSGFASNGGTFLVTPNITSLNPASGPVGTLVTIAGTNFGATQGISSVTFNGTATSPTTWSDTSITVPVPAGASTGNVVVTVCCSATSNGVLFTVTMPPPNITSLNPTAGSVGALVMIAGTNFGPHQGTSTVTFNGTPATPTGWGDTIIGVPVPTGGTTGNVVVTVGGIASNGVNFSVAPNISSLNPVSGLQGTSVTITGTNFGATQGASTVTFNGTTATPTSWSTTSILVPVPAGATTGNVVVTVGGLASNGAPFTVAAVPNITSINPTSGLVGTSVTIAGTNFGPSQGSSTVTFNGTAGTPTSWNATSIVVPLPAAATTGNVVVTVGGVASNGVAFTVIPTPSITSLSPTSGPLGSSVFITGTNFGPPGNNTVTFNGTAATIFGLTGTTISVLVPSGATTGNVVVTVSGVASNGVVFTVTPAPSITSLTPTSGPVGTSVTIAGANFRATQGTGAITFNGSSATPTSWSMGSIVVPVPTGATTGPVFVTVSGGVASNGVLFTLTVPPSITGLLPTSGVVGTSVTVTGANFGASQGTSTVTFNGTAATPTSWSSTSIVVPVPVGATSGNVVVTVGGLSSNGAPFTINPISVGVSPTTVTLGTGGGQQIFSDTVQNDTLGNGVTWSLSGAGCSGAACGTIQPFNAGPGEVYNAPAIAPNPPTVTLTATSVTDPTKSGSATITINQTTPNISSLSPTSGPAGTTVSITGANFGLSQGDSTVTFGGTAASPTNWSSTAITVIVPSGATTGNVVVTVGGFTSNGVAFTVTTQPNITGILPTLGPVGTSVTITGTNFGASQGTSTVSFSGVAGTPVSWSATTIVVPVPAGVAAGSSPVIVIVGGVASSQSAFVVTPRITSLNPSSGPIGTSVTISGSNFGAAQGSSTVTFNGTSASPTTWSDTSIVVPVPSGATTGSLVVTVGPGSISSASAPFTVTATITNLLPNSGLAGTNITISGINFGATQGTSTVTFNGVPATAISWSNTSIFVQVPPSASTGNVVVNVGGSASNGVLFTVPPNITSLSPTSAPVGNSATITGTNFGASQGTSTVAFNGALATPTSWSNASIVVPVPTGATTGNVVVTVNGFASSGVLFTVPVPPSIAGSSPLNGPVGTAVTITGTNFGATQGTSTVAFNGISATPTSWSATSITVPVPSGATSGNIVVTVGGQASNGVPFTVTTSPANIALVQHVGKDAGTTTTTTLAFNNTNTAGNFIAVVIRGGNSNAQVFTVRDSNSNTYKQAKQLASSGSAVSSAIYYAENVKAGANTVTVTMSVSGPLRFAILEYSGVATSNSLDATAAATTTSTSPNSGNLTTTANGDLLLGEVATADSDTYTAGAGYVVRDIVPAAPNTKLITEDQVQSAAGNASASATLSVSSNWAAILAAFKATSGGGGAGTPASITASAGTPQNATVNTAFAAQFQATVKDSFNNPVSGVTVTFSAPTSGPSGTFAGGVNSATTNASGVATSAVFTANAVAGAYTVTASVSGIATPANFSLSNLAGPAANITATAGTPQTAVINTAFAALLQARVTDSLSNPVSGVMVTFTAPASGASGTFAGGVNTATTNAQGIASAPAFTANSTVAGPYTVTASASGVATQANFSLTNVLAAGNITLVQHKGFDSAPTTSNSLAFSARTTAGNFIAVCIRGGLSSSQIFTVSDSSGNTYHQAFRFGLTSAPDTIALFYAENINGGPDIVTVTQSVFAPLRFAILEYSGVATSNSLDGTPATSQGSTATPSTGNMTTSANGDLLLAAMITQNNASFTAGGGYTIEESVPAAPNTKLIAEDRLQTNAGTVSAGATLTSSNIWGAGLAAFRSVSGAVMPVSVSISPATVSLPSGYGTQDFTATVSNDFHNSGVTWSLSGAGCSGATCGTLSRVTTTSVTYTAPMNIPNPATVTLTATSIGDPAKSASATITVTPGVLTVVLSPKRAAVTLSSSPVQFTANVFNDPSNAGVTWQVDGNNGGNSASGTISATGLYIPGTQPGQHTVTAISNANASVSGAALIAVTDLPGVYTHHNDNARTGQNLKEYGLTPTTVSASTFGQLFSCPVDGYVYAQPLWAANLNFGGTKRNVVFIATEHDSVYAFDADSPSCLQLWKVSFLSSGVTTLTSADVASNTDIVPEIGITSTPVIDPSTNTLYVVPKTRETVGTVSGQTCSTGAPCYVHRLHALDLITGAEKFGGPAIITATNFSPQKHLQRPALLLANNTLYLAFGSHGDQCPYQSWVIAYNPATLAQTFAKALSDPTSGCNRGAIWLSGAGPSTDATGNVYVVTGNGLYDGSLNFGDSVVKLSPTGSILDWFTPFNQATLAANDVDLGAAAVLILPDSVGSAAHPHLAVTTGKTAVVYLLDQGNLGKFNSSASNDVQEVIPVPPMNTTLDDGGNYVGPAYWNGNLYLTGQNYPLSQFQISNGVISTPQFATSNSIFPPRGGVPAISANGATSGVLWIIDYSGWQNNAPAVLDAYDANNIGTLLYSSPASGPGAASNGVKFTVPTVANGKVYVGGQLSFTVYGLLPN